MAIITIASLVPISCDPHMYQPTPMDAKAIEEAHLILTIGLSFEGWMNYLISSSGTKGTIFEITNGLSTEAEADSKTVALLIEQINHENIKAIFFENLANRTVIRQIAEETGVNISDKNVLYADSISEENGPAADYIVTPQ
eukprot:gene24267-31547_t